MAPASADITLQMKARGQMLGTVAEDATEYRKGLKVRTDSTSNGVSTSTIMDLSKGRMIMLWHHSKTATVFEPKRCVWSRMDQARRITRRSIRLPGTALPLIRALECPSPQR